MLAGVAFTVRGRAQGSAPSSSRALPTKVVMSAVHHDVSPPLRDLPRLATFPVDADAHEPLRLPPLRGRASASRVRDGALQKFLPLPLVFADILSDFDGVAVGDGGAPRVAPPDTNGAVGLTQYVQIVNLAYAVYNKSDGTLLAGPSVTNSLWAGFGGDCETRNDGDPVVLYDRLADRWVITQLSIGPFRTGVGDFLQCMAVSTSGDATDTYNRYAFDFGPDDFNDYGKISSWPDAYYGNFNIFNRAGTTFKYGKECAFDRTAMQNGDDAMAICFNTPFDAGFLSADFDGTIPPPDGSPNPFVEIWSAGLNSSLAIWGFHVDFTTPDNSTFGPPTIVPAASFTFPPHTTVPQLGTTQLLDTLGDRMMFRLAYRNFGDHESLVANHSVGTSSQVSVRWYEIQDPNGSPFVFQQGTYAPDDSFRWMGSIAMDQMGNIAMGYSVSDRNSNPSLRFTGRLATDDPGVMEDEALLFAGSGSQTLLNRWGDYSSLTLDPSDDCTFYYTTEYIPQNGRFNWRTNVASFKFQNCTGATTTSATVVAPTAPTAVTWKLAHSLRTSSTTGGSR
jgi:hypothetical protein